MKSALIRMQKTGTMLMTIIDLITDKLLIIAAALVVLMIALVGITVVLRYFLHYSVGWSIEIISYLMYVVVILAAPWLLKMNEHVTMDVLKVYLGRTVVRRINVFINLFGCALSLILLYHGLIVTYSLYMCGANIVGVFHLPKYLIIMFLPIMFFLCFFQFIKTLMNSLQAK